MLSKIQSIKQKILEVHKTNNFGGNEVGCFSVFHSNQHILSYKYRRISVCVNAMNDLACNLLNILR